MVATAKHPAPYSVELIEPIVEMLKPWAPNDEEPNLGIEYEKMPMYDPMAGDGKRLASIAALLGVPHRGSELEPEFIADPLVTARDLRDYTGSHAIVVTSPAYGNRLADQYLGTPAERELRAATGKVPRRRGYAVALGRKCSPGSGAALQWGQKYRDLHFMLFQHVICYNVVDGGVLLLNIASHFRGGEYQPVAEWYLGVMVGLGMILVDYRFIETPGYRDGDNRDDRVGGEHLMLWRKPDLPGQGGLFDA